MSFTPNLKYAAILVFCSIYIPFEDYFVYLLPISNEYKILLKQGSELILYSLLAITLMEKIRCGQLRYSPIDLLILSFIGVAILGILVHSAPWVPALNNLRVLIRHFAVYYIVFYSGLPLSRWHQIRYYTIFVILVASVMSLLQYVGSNSISSLIKIEEKIRLTHDSAFSAYIFSKDEKIGAVQAMFESPGTLGIFLFSVLLLLITKYVGYSRFDSFKTNIAIFLTLILSFFTFSKTAFLLNILIIALFYYFFIKKIRLTLQLIVLFCVIGTSMIYMYTASFIEFSSAMKEDVGAFSNIVNLFSAEYWSHFFSAERGWIISEVAPQIISFIPLIGFSSDPETAKYLIMTKGINLYRLSGYTAFEDVYIVALLAYYGLIGLILFFTILLVLMRCGVFVLSYARIQKDQELAALTCAFLALSLGAFIYSFFERIYEIKVFSFYYWMLAGTIARYYVDIRHHNHCNYQ